MKISTNEYQILVDLLRNLQTVGNFPEYLRNDMKNNTFLVWSGATTCPSHRSRRKMRDDDLNAKIRNTFSVWRYYTIRCQSSREQSFQRLGYLFIPDPLNQLSSYDYWYTKLLHFPWNEILQNLFDPLEMSTTACRTTCLACIRSCRRILLTWVSTNCRRIRTTRTYCDSDAVTCMML